MDYAQSILDKLKKADIRAELDDRSEKIGKKITGYRSGKSSLHAGNWRKGNER